MSKLHAAFDLRPFLGALCMVTKSACEGLPLAEFLKVPECLVNMGNVLLSGRES